MRRAQLKHILLDVDFFNNPKILGLDAAFGAAGKSSIVEIYCLMSRATDAIIAMSVIILIARRNGCDPEAFFKYCCSHGLIKQEGSGYSNQPVIEDQEAYARKLDTSNARVTRYRSVTTPEKKHTETRTPDTDFDNDIDPDLNKLDIALLEFQDPKTAIAIKRWKAHRQAIGRPFDQMMLDALQSLYAGRADELADDIDHSISNGWKTINAKNRPRAGPSKKSTKDTLTEMMDAENKRILNEQN